MNYFISYQHTFNDGFGFGNTVFKNVKIETQEDIRQIESELKRLGGYKSVIVLYYREM